MLPGPVIIRGPRQREYAARLVASVPLDTVVTFRELTRTLDQNAKMWCLIQDIAKARPDGREHTPEVWKCLFMHACGHEIAFAMGLNGEPFPVGFRSSKLTVRQMADLITFIYEYGDRHGVQWSE